MYRRRLQLSDLLQHKSLFLLGPRQTGKSTLLRRQFPDARFVDLLEADTFRTLAARPERLRQSLKKDEKTIVIDEIQKLPEMLDEVQLLIDRDPEIRFVLTGSSARKLKRGRANLLAGRAWSCRLHPLCFVEHGEELLQHRLTVGGLPAVLDSQRPKEDLRAYVGTYLQEEIQAEGLTRSIENFSRFLEVAGLSNGELLNYTSIGDDAQIPPRTVREYYRVLIDTLIGYELPAYRETTKRKPVAKSKFYLFDIGVANTLLQRSEVRPDSEAYGRAVEHLVFLELKAALDYFRNPQPLTFWRSTSGFEVDFVVADQVAIEVKASRNISRGHLKGLRALRDELPHVRCHVVSGESQWRKTDDGIEIWPLGLFLTKLWAEPSATDPGILPG